MARGVKTGGRKKGAKNKATAEREAAVAASGVTPLEFMLNIMRGESPADADPVTKLAFATLRFEAAKATAPYVHPKLQPVDGKTGSAEVQARVTVEFVGTAP